MSEEFSFERAFPPDVFYLRYEWVKASEATDLEKDSHLYVAHNFCGDKVAMFRNASLAFMHARANGRKLQWAH